MVKLGGVIGAVLAVAILWVFTEWLFVDWVNRNIGGTIGVAYTFAVAVLGYLVGARVARRLARTR